MEKELKIEVPQGYEIDKEKSTFEKIVFKKVNPFSELPQTWEEYCKQTKNRTYYCYSPYNESHVGETAAEGFCGEFSTKERAKQYVALGKLLQLRDYWVGDWEPNIPNLNNSAFAVFFSDISKDVKIVDLTYTNLPLTFPTKEMAYYFKNCFKDLIKRAYPLV